MVPPEEAPRPAAAGANAAFDPAVLVAHHDFVRRLARGLVSDRDAADELTSRALAAAVAQRPATGPGFRVWLAQVTRRLFLRERRDHERRERRERAAAPGEAQPPTVDLVAEIELHQRVARAFESLEGASKSALFLRYFHDRMPAEIAQELGLPLATVKSRLARGLQQLRERLDASHGGRREEWLTGMLPWIGGPLVTTKVKLVPIAVAALLIAGATVGVQQTWKRAHGGDAESSRSAPAIAAPVTDAATGGRAVEESARAVERTRVVPDPASLPFASGVVVDEQGAPLAGVEVVASRIDRRPINDYPIQEPLRLDRLERDRLATSDAGGRFVVAELNPDLAGFAFVRAGFAAAEWCNFDADRARNQELRVVLHAGAKLEGRVVDSEHRPLAEVRIELLPTSEPGVASSDRIASHLKDAPHYRSLAGVQTAATDERGSFRFDSLPLRPCRLSVMAIGYTWTQIAAADVRDPCEIVLPRAALLVDVTDGDSHEPIDAALLVLEQRSGEVVEQDVPWKWTDVDHSLPEPKGRLAVHTGFRQPYKSTPSWLTPAAGGHVAVKIRVVAPGYVGEERDVDLSPDEEPPHLRIALTPAVGSDREPSITGKVTGAATAATLFVYALIPNWSEEYLENRQPLLTARCDADGFFELFDLPKGRYRLRAEATGCAPAWSEVAAPASGVTLTLAASATLEVVVHDRTGRPADGVVVHAQALDGKHAWSEKTDPQGIAKLERLPAGALRVGAFERLIYSFGDEKIVYALDARTLPDDGAVELRAGEEKRLELLLVERVPVHLHFERDDGSPVVHANLELQNFSGPVCGALHELERLRPLALEIDSRGDATAELYPGHYSFQVSESIVKRAADFDVPRTGEARATVKLPALGPTGVIAGRLIDLQTKRPIAKRKVYAFQKGDDSKWLDLGVQLSDDDGRFRFESAPVGSIQLSIEGGSRGDALRWNEPDPSSPYGEARRIVDVVANQASDVEIELPPIHAAGANAPTVDLEARVTDATTGRPIAKAYVQVKLNLGGTSHELIDSPTDDDGRLSAKLYPGETYSVTVWTAGSSGDGSSSPYQTQHLELAPKDGLLRVDVALTPQR